MEGIEQALKALEALESDSSTSTKRFILHENRDNPAFRFILKSTYDPSMVYYVKKLPEEVFRVGYLLASLSENMTTFTRLLSDLSNRYVTGNEALNQIISTFQTMSPIEQKWYARVLQKDLNVGVKSTMINQEIPGLIPVFSVQLAKEWDGVLSNHLIVQPKLDGYRCMANTTTGKLFSRNGKVIEGYDELEAQVRLLPDGYNIDGEIMSVDFKGTQTQAFRKSGGKVGVLNAFDVISENGPDENVDQVKRLGLLQRVASDSTPVGLPPRFETSLIKVVEAEEIYSKDLDEVGKHLDDYYRKCLQQGYEGVMLKDPDAPYVQKRSRNWQKLKPVKSLDLKVTGVEEGGLGTKYLNSTGKIIVNFEGCSVGVGSGLSDEQRLAWWLDPTLIVGKTVEVLYQEVTTNQLGGKSLRFPRFKCIRTDK